MNFSTEEFSSDGNPDSGWNDTYDGQFYQKVDIVQFILVVFIIVFIVGLPTNLMAVWVFLFRTKKKNPASILMASLALTDLLFVIGLLLIIICRLTNSCRIFGDNAFSFLMGSFYSNMYSSTIFIAVISVQRYWAVVHPLSNRFNNRVAVCVSVLVWVIVWLLSIGLYMYHESLYFLAAYFLTMGIVGFVVPCIVCVVSYVLIFRHLRNSAINSSSNKNKQKAIRLMIIILFLFLVTFTPSNILQIVFYSRRIAGLEEYLYYDYIPYIIALCLSSLNSCIDPFVYYFISNEFRDHVRNMFMCRSERKAKRIKISSIDKQNSSC